MRLWLVLALALLGCTPTPPDGQIASGGEASPARESSPAEPSGPRPPQVLELDVVAIHPHDVGAFTQGLLLHEGRLYEGTGQNGRSELREVDRETGRVIRRAALEDRLFGEGLAVVPAGGGRDRDRFVQLTWQAGEALVWDLETFELLETWRYLGEGWGLTWDGERLVRSDGSDELIFHHPETFEELGRLPVREAGQPINRINELEWVNGQIWANIWGDNRVVRIDPGTGEVTGTADLRELFALLDWQPGTPIDVLNGIAHDPTTGTFLVTGKLWPKLFEIELEPAR